MEIARRCRVVHCACRSQLRRRNAAADRRRTHRRNHRHRAEARHLAAGSAVLGRRGDRRRHRAIGRDQHRRLARNVPGLYITDLGPGQSQVAIRGISAGQVVRDQPGVKESVGIYLDESPISVALFTPDLDLYDLDRIEVLRGPQGTLFGAGSSSGTVRYITAQPDIGEFGGSVDVTRQRSSPTVSSAAHCAARSTCRSAKAPPCAWWAITASCRASSTRSIPGRDTREDVNSGSRTGGRLAFRFEPNENFAITPRVVYQKLETDGYPRIDVYNILGNPYTTTEPPVDPGERGQVTQFREGLTDEFMHGATSSSSSASATRRA